MTRLYDRASDLAGEFSRSGEIYPPDRYCSDIKTLVAYLRGRDEALAKNLDEKIDRLVLDSTKSFLSHEELFFVRLRIYHAIEEISKWMKVNPTKDDIELTVQATNDDYLLRWLMTTAWRCDSFYQLFYAAYEILMVDPPLKIKNERWFMPEIDNS